LAAGLRRARERQQLKLLVLLPQGPGPWANAASRYFAPSLRRLAARGTKVLVLAACPANERDLSYFDGSGIEFRLFDSPPAVPFLERKLRSLVAPGWELSRSEFGEAARRAAGEGVDAILAEMPSTARCVLDDPRLVCSVLYLRYRDLEPFGEPESISAKWERIQARRSEHISYSRSARLRVISSRLRDYLDRDGIGGPKALIPLCLDSALYPAVAATAVPTVGVLGSMFWPPSRRAAERFLSEVAPGLRKSVPGVRFVVGGWRAKEFLGGLVRDGDVELLDSFPDPREAFSRLSVLVYAPPVGTGMKVKVLEAMAYGVPAVVNEEGFEGLDVAPEGAVERANTTPEIVDAVTGLLRDPGRRKRCAEAARIALETVFSPVTVGDALFEMLGGAT
jgi:polysaccharide biosynthesis protein PslH